MSEQTTCEPLSHENVAWAAIPQTTHPDSYQFLASPAKVGSSTVVRVPLRHFAWEEALGLIGQAEPSSSCGSPRPRSR